jgi:hypothetical protein
VAHSIDHNRQANDAFQANLGAKLKAMAQPMTTQMNASRSFLNLPQPAKDPAPCLSSAPTPVDLDAPKKHCRSPDHFSRQCPHAYDVRYMTIKEKQEWIGQVLADEDVKTGIESETKGGEKEDFATSSR